MSFASFLSSILTSGDNDALVTGALQLAELLLVKLPTIYGRSFQREGVIYEIDKLAKEELSPSARSKRKEEGQNKGSTVSKAGTGTASPSAAQEASSAAVTPVETPSSDVAAASRFLRALAGEEAGSISALERALGAGTSKQASSSRRVSSVPSNPRDANIVRARILQIKRWSLIGTKGPVPAVSSVVDAVILRLSDPDIADSDLRSVFDQIAALLTDKVEPLSSFEMLQSGLLAKLMAMLQEGAKGKLYGFSNLIQ